VWQLPYPCMAIRSNRLPLALHAGRPFMAFAACCTVQTRPSACGFVVSASVIRVGVQCSADSNGGPVLIKLEDDHQVALTAFDELKQNHPHGGGSGRRRRRRQPSPAPNKTLIRSGGERTDQTNSKPKTAERAAKLNLGRHVWAVVTMGPAHRAAQHMTLPSSLHCSLDLLLLFLLQSVSPTRSLGNSGV
jgi:hypothetical protein